MRVVMEEREAAIYTLPVEHFEHVGQSLPELTTELLSAHTTQSSEMQEKEALLQRLETELGAVNQQLHVLNREVCNAVRTICLKEDLLAELSQDCEQLEQEVAALVQDKEAMKVSVRKVQRERAVGEEVKDSYKKKMESHRMKTHQLEQLSCTRIELKALREKIDNLKEKSI